MNTVVKIAENPKLNREIMSLVRAIHKQRTYLVNSGLNQKKPSLMRMCLDKLQPYLNYKFTDEGAARFIIKNKAYIRAIMRDGDMIAVARFDSLLTAATFFVNPQTSFNYANSK